MDFSNTKIRMDGYYLTSETDQSGFLFVFSNTAYNYVGIYLENGIPHKNDLNNAFIGVSKEAHNTMYFNVEDSEHIHLCYGEIVVLDNGLKLQYLDKIYSFVKYDWQLQMIAMAK